MAKVSTRVSIKLNHSWYYDAGGSLDCAKALSEHYGSGVTIQWDLFAQSMSENVVGWSVWLLLNPAFYKLSVYMLQWQVSQSDCLTKLYPCWWWDCSVSALVMSLSTGFKLHYWAGHPVRPVRPASVCIHVSRSSSKWKGSSNELSRRNPWHKDTQRWVFNFSTSASFISFLVNKTR